MARRRDFVRGASAISHKRLSTWAALQPINGTMTAAGGTIFFTLSATGLALRPFTIVRTRLKYMVVSDQAAAIETQVGAIGAAVVSTQASAIGVTAVPTPITDMESDLWFVHEIFMAQESNLTDRSKVGISGEIDSKAMRKVEDGEDVIIVAEFSAAASTGGLVLTLGGRMLLKVN